ncbi:MAG TPA: SdrD B-like domain-containing protein [Tepidisphaeraceae bacterium]|jgi:probable HAF family extracellular repeat protein|nr:SdrD B-like domain-containing protein [Tepidisphaeraceae bacterium]
MGPPRRRYRRNKNSQIQSGPVRPIVERIEARLLMTTVYAVTDLGSLGGGNTVVAGINSAGQIVGGSNVKSGVQHPFLYTGGRMIDLGVPAGATSATAVAINAKGDVLIEGSKPIDATPSDGSYESAYLYSGGVVKSLGNLPGFNSISPTALNDSDTIVGSCEYFQPGGANYQFSAFIYQNNSLKPLAVAYPPYAINDAGTIGGYNFIDTAGVIATLGNNGAGPSTIQAINASGNSTGYSLTGYGDALALFSPKGVLTQLSIPGATYGDSSSDDGNAINNSGVIVGSGYSFPGAPDVNHALIEQNGLVQDLNTLIDPANHITLKSANGINAGGSIVATTSNGHSVLLTPQSKTLGAISGTVFNDQNGDGVQQAGEPGLAGQTLFLDLNNNGAPNPGEPTAVTNAAGHYAFNGLWEGTYTVANVLPSNAWRQTLPAANGTHVVTLSLGKAVSGENFAEQQLVAYALTDLSPTSSAASQYYSSASAINASGQVAGGYATSVVLQQPTLFNTNGTRVDLSAAGGEALGINDSGQVVGEYTVGSGSKQTTYAFVYANGKITNLGALPGDVSSGATSINNAGEIVGDSTSAIPPFDPNDPYLSATTRGFIDVNGKLMAVNPNLAMNLFIDAVNDSGVFVGEENSPGYKGPDYNVPFISVNGKVVDITSVQGSLNAINNAGKAVGAGDSSNGSFSGAFSYLNGKMTPIAGLQAADGINDAGVIVGVTLDSDGNADHGAVDIGGKVIDLNNTIPAGSFTITAANAVNASGWIAANATDANHNSHAVLLKPILASVSGSVFFDRKSSGAYQSGDTPLAGRQVYVDVDNKGHYVAGDPTALTDANGNYTITGVPTGGCTIRAVEPGGWYQTTPAAGAGIYVSAGAGANVKVQAFGEGTPANLSISGEVFNDLNDSAGKNPKDPGIAGVTVYLDANNNGKRDSGEQSFVTGANGNFSFDDLLPGVYVVRAVTPSGFKQSTPLNGGANTVTLTVGRSVNNAYFGETAIKSK